MSGSNLLNLDFVSHISLVDDPAVPEAKFLVAKRADDVEKAGRTLSRQNYQTLEEILQAAKNGKITEVQRDLETFLQQAADPEQVENSETVNLSKIAKSMSGDGDTDTDALIEAIKEATAEGVQEGLQEAGVEPDSDGDSGASGDGGGTNTSDVEERLSSIEERIEDLADSDADGDGEQETEDADGDGEPEDDSLEKRLETLEKAVDQGDRRGSASIQDAVDQEEADGVAKSDGSWNFTETIQKNTAEEGGD